MDVGNETQNNINVEENNFHTEQDSFNKNNKKRKHKEQQQFCLEKEKSCSSKSETLEFSYGIPLSKYARPSAVSVLLNNNDNNDSKNANSNKNSTHVDLSTISSSDQLHILKTGSMISTNTTSLLASVVSKGATFLRTNTAYTPNMVPNVAALFLAASQYYKTFGVFPQFNPAGYMSRPAPAMSQQQTLPPLGQPVCSKASSRSAFAWSQSRTGTHSAGPAAKEATSKIAAIVGHPREWEYTDYGKKHRAKAREGSELSVMSYNILAQGLLEDHPHLYDDHGDHALSWDYRRQRLVQEISFHHADVVCLQEVQNNHYSEFINPELRKRGYEGVYHKRTGNKCDGCAIFFNKQKFSLIRSHNVEFKRGGLLDRDNVAVILELRPRTRFYSGTVEKICVATTHLLFNPKRGDIKMGQLMILLAELDRCARSANSKYAPVILCGDFNLEPYSHLYNMLCHGHLRFEGLCSTELSGQKEGYYGYRKDKSIHRDIYQSLNINENCQYMVKDRKDRQATDGIGGKHVMNTGTNSTKLSNERTSGSGDRSPVIREKSIDSRERSPATQDSREKSLKSNELTTSSTDGTSNQGTADKYRWTAGQQNAAVSDSSAKNREMNYVERPSGERPASGQLRHGFHFVSSYNHYIERLHRRVQEVTTHHRRAACTVDYIFYTVDKKTVRSRGQGRRGGEVVREGKLVLLARYGLMSSQEIDQIGCMPNYRMPSDHLPLLSRFLLKV